MTSNQPYTITAGQARETTERVVGAWKEGMKKLADQTTLIPTMPPVDLNQSVEQYFQFVQRTVDLNRDLATSWAELVNTLTGVTREQAESFSRIVKDQADTLAGMAAQQAEQTQQVGGAGIHAGHGAVAHVPDAGRRQLGLELGVARGIHVGGLPVRVHSDAFHKRIGRLGRYALPGRRYGQQQ